MIHIRKYKLGALQMLFSTKDYSPSFTTNYIHMNSKKITSKGN